MRGEEKGSEGNSVSPSPLPPPFYFFFFCSRSNFGAITRLGTLATQAMSKWEGGGEEGRGRDLGRGVSLLFFFYSFPFPFLRLLPRLADIIRLILISKDQCCYPLLDLMLIFLPDIINLHLIYRYPTFIVVSALSDITRNFSDDDGHVNEDVEKAIGLLSKIATQRACPTGTPFLYISFQSPHNCFTGRFMEDINAHKLKFGTQRIPGKNLPTFDISCKQFKIIATNFQKTRWLFNIVTSSLSSQPSLLKLPTTKTANVRKISGIFIVYEQDNKDQDMRCVLGPFYKKKKQ